MLERNGGHIFESFYFAYGADDVSQFLTCLMPQVPSLPVWLLTHRGPFVFRRHRFNHS